MVVANPPHHAQGRCWCRPPKPKIIWFLEGDKDRFECALWCCRGFLCGSSSRGFFCHPRHDEENRRKEGAGQRRPSSLSSSHSSRSKARPAGGQASKKGQKSRKHFLASSFFLSIHLHSLSLSLLWRREATSPASRSAMERRRPHNNRRQLAQLAPELLQVL